MVDSGATHHITPHCSNFLSWSPAKGAVSLGRHAEISQIGTGSVAIRPSRGDRIVHLHDVMHVPDAGARYFSVSALMQKGGRILFKDQKLTISIRGQQSAQGYQEGNLFWIDTSTVALHVISNASTPIHLWHERMGHMSTQALKHYKDSVKGISLDPSSDHDQLPCPGCKLGKQMRSPFSSSSKQSDHRLRIIHSDLAGPIQPQSIQGSSYIATFIDDYSRHGVVYFLRTKDQCALGFWELAVDTAVHTYNRTPTRTIGWRTPHELWTDGHVPDVSYFRIFGCKAYVHTPEAKCTKLDPRSVEMTLVGYEPGSKGYRLWNSTTQSVVLSRDVTFDERSFPYKETRSTSITPSQPIVSEGPVTVYYNAGSDGGPAPQAPTLPTMPAHNPTPE